MKIIDLYNEHIKGHAGAKLFNSTAQFMADYTEAYSAIDYDILVLFGQREICNPFEEDAIDTYSFWNKAFNGYIHRNEFNLSRIYYALHKVYEPLDNYNKVSDIAVTEEGTEKEVTKERGKETDKTKVGHADTTSTDKTAPMNNTSLRAVAETHVETQEQNNEVTREFENRETENERSFDARKTKTHEETKGNIGVTTSMQMLSEEYQGRFAKDFYIDLFAHFINEVTIWL